MNELLAVMVEPGHTTGEYVDQLVEYLEEVGGSDVTRERAADAWLEKARKAGISLKRAEKLVELALLVITEDSRH